MGWTDHPVQGLARNPDEYARPTNTPARALHVPSTELIEDVPEDKEKS